MSALAGLSNQALDRNCEGLMRFLAGVLPEAAFFGVVLLMGEGLLGSED